MKTNFLISNDSFLKALEFAQAIAKQTGGRVATMADIAVMRTKKELMILFGIAG